MNKTKRQSRILLVIFLTLSVCPGVHAAYPLVTDDAEMVATDIFELEVGYENCRDENDLISHICGITLKHGLTERVDLGIYLPYQIDPVVEDRFGASSILLKYSLIKNNVAFSVSKEFDEMNYFLNAIFTKEFSTLNFHLSAGYLSMGEGSENYGAAVEIPFNKIEAVAEAQGDGKGNGNALFGIRYWIKSTFFVSAGISRTSAADSDKGTAGFHWEF